MLACSLLALEVAATFSGARFCGLPFMPEAYHKTACAVTYTIAP
jgi:hypothetical protein